ncbi:MAG: DUF4386 domain-containing protein [Anaerolineaceae bacterium]|nr:DUF4386 domain-containing protein [Anaerolineaceae bacterium]
MQKKPSRILGIAFLLQFITSFSSGMFIRLLWMVEGDMVSTLLKIADQSFLLRINILVDLLTALGVIFLGAELFRLLKSQNSTLARTALGFYILEGCLLVVSRMEAFSLLHLSQSYTASGQPEQLLQTAQLALDSMVFMGETLHMMVFSVGGILFYYLLDRSHLVPRWMSLWGLISIIPYLPGTIATVLDVNYPYFLMIPYIPFELMIGLWISVKGIQGSQVENGVHHE